MSNHCPKDSEDRRTVYSNYARAHSKDFFHSKNKDTEILEFSKEYDEESKVVINFKNLILILIKKLTF